MYSVVRATPPSTSLSEESTNSSERLLISSLGSRSHNTENQVLSKALSSNNCESGSFLNYMINQHRSSGIFIFESTSGAHTNSDFRELAHVSNQHPHILGETNMKLSQPVALNSGHKLVESTCNVPQEIPSNNVPVTTSSSSGLLCCRTDKRNVSATHVIDSTSKCAQELPVLLDGHDPKISIEEQNLTNACTKISDHQSHLGHQNNQNEVVCCMNCKRCLHSIFCFHHISVCCQKNATAEMSRGNVKDSDCFNSMCKHALFYDCSQPCCKRPVSVKNVVTHCLNSMGKMPSVVVTEKFISCESVEGEETSNKMNSRVDCLDGSQTHTCEVCFKSYASSAALANHIRYHKGERPYQCETCNKAFATNSHLVTHRRIHTGERPFQCQSCQRCFADRSAFIKHERTHGPNGSIIKRFKCDECGHTFVDSCGLKKHVRTHTGERPYKCSICEKCFSTSSTFVAHKRIHSGERPYKCDQCTKMFITKSHLLTHRRVHTGEKPFTCQVCSRSFADGSSFRRHERLHTSENRHVCDLCGKGFQCDTSLDKHKQSHISGSSTFVYMM